MKDFFTTKCIIYLDMVSVIIMQSWKHQAQYICYKHICIHPLLLELVTLAQSQAPNAWGWHASVIVLTILLTKETEHILFYIPGDPGCGGTFTDSEGIIISPNWPNDYAHNRQCVYVISLPVGEKVTLNFTHMSLENHSSCSFDYVEVGFYDL